MLPQGDKAKRLVAQAPLKTTTCFAGCGATVEYRTNPRVCCPPCKVAGRLENTRRAAEKQRRKRGARKLKGSVIQCQVCAVDVVLSGSFRAKYCRPCYLANNAAEARERSQAKRNTEAGRAYFNEWHRERLKKDPAFSVSAHVRKLMHRALGKGKAGKSWREFVPYTLDELMRHLERQFLPGMSWDNRSDWHIDHITPLASFEFASPEDEAFKAAWALTNLRPFWALDNIRKNATRTHLL